MSRLPPIVTGMLAAIPVLPLVAFALLAGDSGFYPFGTTLAVIVSVLAILIACLLVLLQRRWWTAALLVSAALLAVWQIAAPRVDRRVVLARTDPGSRSLERHFIVGYVDLTRARELVRDTRIGGLFITRRNVEGRPAAHIRAEIAQLQAIRRAAGLPALIIAADQEGGPVSHLSPPLPAPPPLSTLAALAPQERPGTARRLGFEVGSEMRSIGVTMDLAPVCDLMPAGAPGLLDRETLIRARAISDDPSTTAVICSGFAAGLLAAGITPTAKRARARRHRHASVPSHARGRSGRSWRA